MSKHFAPACPPLGLTGDRIELAHGGGGLKTRQLIEGIFRPALAKRSDDFTHDGARLEIDGARMAFTTDSYVVRPLFFPGGDIGTLAIYGTVNDLAMCGAEPVALSLALVLEEGLAIADLQRIASSIRDAADAAGVAVVTGDTKVVERGKGDGVYINTSGLGRIIARNPIIPQRVQPGDIIILSGDIGRHGVAVMAKREGFRFETEIMSDCAPLWAPVQALIGCGCDLHCLRDLTRGGLATGLIEIALAAGIEIMLDEHAVAVSEPVRGACEILGFDPLYVANEGRFVAVLPHAEAAAALECLRGFDPAAAIIGRVERAADEGSVIIDTLGGSRSLDLMSGEQLPRIC